MLRRARSRRPSPRAACTPRSARRRDRRRAGRSGPRPRCCRRSSASAARHAARSVVDRRRLRMQLHADLEACHRSRAPRRLLGESPCRRDCRGARSGGRRRAARSSPRPRAAAAAARRRARRANRSRAGSGRPCSSCVRSARVASTAGSRSSSRRALREPRADHGDRGRERAVDVIGLGQAQRPTGSSARPGVDRREQIASAVPSRSERPSMPRIAGELLAGARRALHDAGEREVGEHEARRDVERRRGALAPRRDLLRDAARPCRAAGARP